MPPPTVSQRAQISQFMSITGATEKSAAKTLKAFGWKLEQACDSFYATNGIPAPGGKEKEREALAKLFEKYREPDDEEDTAGLDGTMKYLEDLGVDMETAEFLVPLEIIGAPVVGEIAKAGFVDGWKSFGADTISKQKTIVAERIKRLGSDMALFKQVYRHTFICGREKGQKALPLENAITYWQIMFSPPGRPWVTASTDWTELWVGFLKAKWTKSVNKDMWNQTGEFFQKSLQDDTLSFWGEDGAWPGVIDDFVAYAKEKRGSAPEGMETD